jgi:hypothetical protein
MYGYLLQPLHVNFDALVDLAPDLTQEPAEGLHDRLIGAPDLVMSPDHFHG